MFIGSLKLLGSPTQVYTVKSNIKCKHVFKNFMIRGKFKKSVKSLKVSQACFYTWSTSRYSY